MRAKIDLTGRQFGFWSVLYAAEPPPTQGGQSHWFCRCQCGKESVRKGSYMVWAEKNDIQQSCQSCAAKLTQKHKWDGLSGTPEFKIWYGMIDRCQNPAHRAYLRYGGRGITVCERWQNPLHFLADIGARPSVKHSLDRIDNNGGYSPENCRWADWKTQNRNKAGAKPLVYKGETRFISDLAVQTGLSTQTIRQRIGRMNWTVEKALETPTDVTPKGRIPKLHTVNGISKTRAQWADHIGVNKHTIYTWLGKGQSLEDIVARHTH